MTKKTPIKTIFKTLIGERVQWRNVYWWNRKIKSLLVIVFWRKIVGNKGTYIMKEDWDNLIILDACRYDTFKEVTDTNPDYRISRGSSTQEFVEENFGGQKYYDTVVVTANPYLERVKESFYKVISVWKSGWDDRLNTVLPQTMYENAVEAGEKYPDKRLVVWFMQPHQPFIENPKLSPQGFKYHLNVGNADKNTKSIITPWMDVERGNIDIRELWAAYRRNLEIVFPYALDLAKSMRGKTVITSDHGNAFKRLYFPLPVKIAGHPTGVYIPELIKIPWLTINNSERKEIKVGEVEVRNIKEKIKELRKLGKI